MKKKFLLFVIRCIRFLGKESQLIPELRCVPKIKTRRLYKHYGRILLAHENPDPVEMHYFRRATDTDEWKEIRQAEYNQTLQQQEKGKLRDVKLMFKQTGAKCEQCACEQLHLPCACGFEGGERSGYYELIYEGYQPSDITTL
jgi:hypothetical protein